ncbi:MAG TPA: ABC transporter ATP-binding protein [Actinomycetes bacterium]|jgi:branched-chain amino acid transport system ATP-binding protein|nr:ABC transporter ATP-binding protein [Actinomycetes bacterium]
MSASNGVALQLSELTRRFGGIFAVSGVNLRVQAGSRHGIIGPNGAGKTTLFNVISGELRASEGRIHLFGSDITHLSPRRRVEMGLGRTYQITRTFPTLTVRENLTLGLHGLRRSKFSMLRPWKGYQHEAREAEELSERIGLSLRLNERVANLSHGEIRQLEVALALALSPKLLLLDEPCAGLSPAERAGMSQLLRRLPSELTLVMIEHDMDVVRESVDKITVLHLGEVVAEGTTKEIERHTTVREIYLGSRG